MVLLHPLVPPPCVVVFGPVPPLRSRWIRSVFEAKGAYPVRVENVARGGDASPVPPDLRSSPLIFCPHWSKCSKQEHLDRQPTSGCVFRRRSWSFDLGGNPLHPIRPATYRFGFDWDVIGALDWKRSRIDPKDERRPHEPRFPREITCLRWHGRKESATWRRTAKAAP